MKIINFFAILSVGIILSSCSVMSVEECKTADWKEVGYKDGSNGLSKQRFSEYISACKEGHVKPNQITYDIGYHEGLKTYCTPQNIFNKSLEGKGGYRSCPAEKQVILREYYDVGNHYYKAKTARTNLLRDISNHEEQLKLKDLKKDKKEKYKKELDDLESNRSRINREFYDAEDKMERFKRTKNLY